jgi:lysophospholipase L1-like esterase
LLTPLSQYTAAIDEIATRLTGLSPEPNVAIAGVPNAASIPWLSKGFMYFCLNTGLCPGVPATAPFTSPNFTVDASCAPSATPGVLGPGEMTLTPFSTATAQIAGVLAAGGAASINCATGVATVTTLAGTTTLPTINPTEFAALAARVAAFNTHVRSVAQANGWAYVNLDSTLAAQAANPALVPPFPSFTTPDFIFGTLFSLDGVHPRKAGYRIMAQAFAAAINATYGTTLTVP